MSVKKYSLNINKISGEGYIKLPISLDFSTTDQAEVVEKDFVSKEVEKSINPIIDYEKSRFGPIKNNILLTSVKYQLNFINMSGIIPSESYLSDIGFVNDDIKYRKNNFVRSFLRLNFYDSPIPSNQRLLSYVTIYSRLSKGDTIPMGNPNSGQPLDVNQLPVKFIVNNPIQNPEGFAEGFYLYNFKDEVTLSLPKEIYMRAEYNNAKAGKRTTFTTVNYPLTVDNLVGNLYTKYVLTREATGFYYTIDNSYSPNVDYSSDFDENGLYDDVIVKLYEIQVL